MKRILLAGVAAMMMISTSSAADPTLDTSSLDAFKASIEAMTAALPEDQRKPFNQAWFTLTLGAKGEGMQGMVDQLKPYTGKTAAEIIAIAEETPLPKLVQ